MELPPFFVTLLEGALFGFLTLYNGTQTLCSIISSEDWSRITGPHGVAFIACAAVVVLWLNGLRREQREDKRREGEETKREERHAETLTLQKENSSKLIELNVEQIKAQALATAAMTDLKEHLAARPCQFPKHE